MPTSSRRYIVRLRDEENGNVWYWQQPVGQCGYGGFTRVDATRFDRRAATCIARELSDSYMSNGRRRLQTATVVPV